MGESGWEHDLNMSEEGDAWRYHNLFFMGEEGVKKTVEPGIVGLNWHLQMPLGQRGLVLLKKEEPLNQRSYYLEMADVILQHFFVNII